MMNDFTKDELVKLWRCINPVIIGEDAYDLQIKLQSLIDNYCAHEVITSVWRGKCEKCGKTLL